jgi:hypothetical protein
VDTTDIHGPEGGNEQGNYVVKASIQTSILTLVPNAESDLSCALLLLINYK